MCSMTFQNSLFRKQRILFRVLCLIFPLGIIYYPFGSLHVFRDTLYSILIKRGCSLIYFAEIY